ncbi:hypothetical protein DFQ27_000049 [Actinomortierella ambigua]|uniref:Ricin B lectin domain-containing protein n=1 Tax=Actinomortierella ambigua TaxID=1343610 RepID=A0A9P6UDJ7_9FUNG|nr:hypothetical protein DFQ27_000049 [Actinomortierella ambigua]
MKFITITTAIAVLATTVMADISKIVRVDQSSHQFIDATGRSRFFHGTNMVYKEFPWHHDLTNFKPSWSIVEKDIQTLKDLNINSVRLGVHWAGVEPVRGQYNQTYLDTMKGIVQKFQDNGIYTLVDHHQDVWAAQLCGHGAPLWFVKKDWVPEGRRFPVPQKWSPFAVDANGVPSAKDCGSIDWSLSYLNYGVGNAFGRLYNNYDNLGDTWANYWKVLAENFKDFPGVQGYDLMNEPWVGDHMADPTLLIPGTADRRNMEALWNKGNKAIRSVDPTTIVYFEGSTFDILSGFNNVPGADGSKTAHSWHYYKPPQLFGFETTMKNRIKDKKRLRTGSMCTEFEMWVHDDSVALAREAVQVMDHYLESWQGWAYENLWGATEVKLELALIYARTYTEATAGTAQTFYFQDSTAKYWVSWLADTSITAPGLIRTAPKYYYPDGVRVFFVPANSGTYTIDDTNIVQLHYTPQTVNGASIQASVQPFFPTDIIKNPASGMCLDVSQGKTGENQAVILWRCTSNWNQVWKFKNGSIMLAWDTDHQHDKFCLDIKGDLSPSSTYQDVVLNSCKAGKQSQQWEVTATGNIVNKATNMCIDIYASNYKDGQSILTYECRANGKQANQVWTLPRGANGQW